MMITFVQKLCLVSKVARVGKVGKFNGKLGKFNGKTYVHLKNTESGQKTAFCPAFLTGATAATAATAATIGSCHLAASLQEQGKGKGKGKRKRKRKRKLGLP